MNNKNKEELEERLHFQKVMNAFRAYKKHSITSIHKREDYLNRLPMEHQKLLRKHGYQETLDDLKLAVDKNYTIINHILKDVDGIFENVNHTDTTEEDPRVRPTPVDMDKIQSTLKQIARDWSSAGAEERSQCYSPVLAELVAQYPRLEERSDVKVLVPGAGLGRLAWEIASKGFQCQGNEFSLYMLFASNFILNKCPVINGFKVQPFSHEFCNNLKSSDQLREISFPDQDPCNLPADAQFSMAAGDFLDVYSAPEYVSSQDCVVTCFFIDCAHNIVEFVQVIHQVLKQGGTWINFRASPLPFL